MIEDATRQVQHDGDQNREHQRPNEAVIKVWEAPRQTGPHPALYHGHQNQHQQKDQQAPPGPEPAFPCIPGDWTQGGLPSTAVRRIAVIKRTHELLSGAGEVLYRSRVSRPASGRVGVIRGQSAGTSFPVCPRWWEARASNHLPATMFGCCGCSAGDQEDCAHDLRRGFS